MRLLYFAAFVALGVVMHFAGIDLTNWAFWAIEACAIVIGMTSYLIGQEASK